MRGPKEGHRAPIREGESPVGGGTTPRFVLFAEPDGRLAELLAEYKVIVEPEVRSPFESGGIWLVRPDGYVGLRAEQGDVEAVRGYLSRVTRLA